MPLFTQQLLVSLSLNPCSLARRLGITPARMYNYRDGTHTPDLKRARLIAQTLNIPLDDLTFKGEHKDLL